VATKLEAALTSRVRLFWTFILRRAQEAQTPRAKGAEATVLDAHRMNNVRVPAFLMARRALEERGHR
jgi:hypothetical protein